MANISGELKSLFKEHMLNKSKPAVSSGRVGGAYKDGILFTSSVKIYFYEWSDVCRVPKAFYTLESFDTYLRGCGIYLQMFEKDIIVNLGESFISCYRGKRLLCIRATYKHLLDAMNDHDRLESDIDKHKLNVFRNNLPSCIHEGQYEGEWFGT